MTYNKEQLKLLKHQFPGIEAIEHNYAQTCQDLFVLSMLNGKRNGFFLEIGAQDPIEISNSYLLESVFDWKGISIDLDPEVAPLHKEKRKNIFVSGDALTVDYPKLLAEHNFPTQIDYLQVDIDPAIQSLNCLRLLPWDKYRFSVITYEHDVYRGANGVQAKEEGRQILAQNGYMIMAGNICNEGSHDPYEDWWVDPKAVTPELIEKFQRQGDVYLKGAEFLGIFS